MQENVWRKCKTAPLLSKLKINVILSFQRLEMKALPPTGPNIVNWLENTLFMKYLEKRFSKTKKLHNVITVHRHLNSKRHWQTCRR